MLRATAMLLLALGLSALPGNPTPADEKGPTLVLQAAQPPIGRRQQFAFEGASVAPIHRAGPEHFKVTRCDNGEDVNVSFDYDRDALPVAEREGMVRDRSPRPEKTKYRYNTLFQGVRVFLDNGAYDAKDTAGKAGYLEVYGRAKLEPGVRYRLTWACWPVGAAKEVEVSCEFELAK
jgi:hypothetical protein